MREFQERRRVKRLLHSRYAIVALVVVCLFLAHGVWDVYGKYEKSKEIADRASTNLAELQSRQDSLSQSIDALGTTEGKENEIRDRFGVVKAGEKVVVVVDASTSNDEQAAVAASGWWSRFWGFFGI